MKKSVILILLSLGLTATANARSVADYPGLSLLMSVASDSASEGASMAMFDYNEHFFHKELNKCSVITAEQAVEEVLDELKYVFESTNDELTYLVEEEGRADVTDLLGKNRYYSCRDGGSVFMGIVEAHRLISTDFKYRLELWVGYED